MSSYSLFLLIPFHFKAPTVSESLFHKSHWNFQKWDDKNHDEVFIRKQIKLISSRNIPKIDIVDKRIISSILNWNLYKQSENVLVQAKYNVWL